MYVCTLQPSTKIFSISVHKESQEPIRVGIGSHGETGIHMTRAEAIDLYSQLEKAIHEVAND